MTTTDSVSESAPRRRGPRGARGDVAAKIIDAARKRFAEDGFAATALTTVARDAGVDNKLVHYYFSSKEELFEATLTVPEDFLATAVEATTSPLPDRGEAIVRNLLRAWDDPQLRLTFRSILLMAAHEEVAMVRVREYFEDRLLVAIEDGLSDEDRRLRVGLISSQLIGLAFSRFVFRLQQVAAIDDDTIVSMVGATVQRYLTGPIE